jgi:RNA-splicing ligase RtcB
LSAQSSVTVFASAASWIESDAVAQCHQVAALDGMQHVAGMPDLHPGKGAPIGAAMASTVLYPLLVGSDIGCGIAVFPIKLKRAVPERLAARFPDLDRALDPERDAGDPAWAVLDGDGRDVLIAGTRGTCSYLVAGHAGPAANHSVAHGAGRKMSRADALRRGRAKHTIEELRRTPIGSFVVCGDRQLLFEEAPTAYKRIEQVIADLVEHDLATPVATTVPLVTYKTPELGSTPPRERRDHRRKRGRP